MTMTIGDLVKAVTEAPASVREKIQYVLTEKPDLAPEADWRTCSHVAAGERLGVSRQVIHQMCKAGQLETRVVGRTNRVLVRSIDAYMKNPSYMATNRKWQPRKNNKG